MLAHHLVICMLAEKEDYPSVEKTRSWSIEQFKLWWDAHAPVCLKCNSMRSKSYQGPAGAGIGSPPRSNYDDDWDENDNEWEEDDWNEDDEDEEDSESR